MSTSSAHAELVRQIPTSYEKAVTSGDLLFFPSTVHKHVDVDVEFEIRLCPALQKKPTTETQPSIIPVDPAADAGLATQGNKGTVFDPFSPPYNANLFVGELQDEDSQEEYVVLLNKYSVVPNHFLLVSKEFKSQSTPLFPPDLVQMYTILIEAKKAGLKALSFYNCGDNSGASQPHKHAQFIPIEDDGPPVEKLARRTKLETPTRPFTLASLPYANHVYRFPSELPSAEPDELQETLCQAFMALLELVISTIRHDPDYPAGKPSYNVLLTLEHLHVIPRRFETHVLQETGDKLSVNSLGFAGMLLVKSEEELEAVKKEGVGKILRSVALNSVHDIQVAGQTEEPM